MGVQPARLTVNNSVNSNARRQFVDFYVILIQELGDLLLQFISIMMLRVDYDCCYLVDAYNYSALS